MCAQMSPGRPFSVENVPFVVTVCERHAHARGALGMPSGGVVTIFATARTEAELVGQVAKTLADILLLAAWEIQFPSAHPFALLPLIGGRVKKGS